jgi:flagellar biosynthesis regulator FlbT
MRSGSAIRAITLMYLRTGHAGAQVDVFHGVLTDLMHVFRNPEICRMCSAGM